MSQIWSDRQRRTNQLVRRVAAHILAENPDGNQLLGLCRLTWITNAYEGDNPAYIHSTKIPALADAIGIDLKGLTLPAVASLVAQKFQDQELLPLILPHTGFTNFYKAYRNSARPWAIDNKNALLDIFRQAQSLNSDEEGEELAARIALLPSIPKANHPEQGMRPEFLLTPVCFALDPRLRFPIINGAGRIKALLRRVGVVDGTTVAKYRALVSLIGRGGIKDAADLDQLGLADQLDLLSDDQEQLRYQLPEQPQEGDELPSKEEEEVARLQQALSAVQRRLHNRMTNQLRRILDKWTLFEGRAADCRYDVLVRNYDGANNDLLIEVKSSTDASQVRMAIGQVFAYWHRLKGDTDDIHSAILFPSRPTDQIQNLLSWLEIGMLWLDDEHLYTHTDWLDGMATLITV
ncbi:MAG: hypothetical protein ABIP34_08365 [Rhodoferax sp.]|uniref:hypothetical protein n=1 Tax=Rhodoferax sp. TaxID=50421 RepID=UPI003267D6ED